MNRMACVTRGVLLLLACVACASASAGTGADLLRDDARGIGLAYAVYSAQLTLLVATLALYSAARDHLFLLYAGFTAAALLFTAALYGHFDQLPGPHAVAAAGALGARGFWLAGLGFSAMALGMLLRFSDSRASGNPGVRRLDILLPGLAVLALTTLLPQPLVSSVLRAIAPVAWILALLAGLWALLDGARRGVPMAFATACALSVLLLAAVAREWMHSVQLDDAIVNRHGVQLALVLVSMTLFVGLSSRIGAVRQRLDVEAIARRHSEDRLRQARAHSEFGQLLQDRLRGLHQEEVAPQAFQFLLQHIKSVMPATQAVVLGQGVLGHDLLLVQEDGSHTQLGKAALAARAVVRAQIQGRMPVQVRLEGARMSDDPRLPQIALVPIHVAAPAWAALVLRDPGRDAFDAAGLEACMELARLTAMHADEAHASIQLRQTAEFDALTGIMNRRSIDAMLLREFAHAKSAPMPLTVLFIDIDWFKRINDEHGHACGDHCLRRIAAALRAELRPNDALGRYGGEEFLVALPGRDAAASRIIAERLRVAVERNAIDWHGQPLAVAISIGLAARRLTDATVQELLERADQALYAAKRAGRNRVCVAPAVFA